MKNEPIGYVGTMPGTNGFTMATFEASKVPVGTALYADPITPRLEECERLLAALWRYGLLHQVEGVIYPETGSHKQTLDAANEYLFQRAIEKEKANA